jgi:hypothetical protein
LEYNFDGLFLLFFIQIKKEKELVSLFLEKNLSQWSMVSNIAATAAKYRFLMTMQSSTNGPWAIFMQWNLNRSVAILFKFC